MESVVRGGSPEVRARARQAIDSALADVTPRDVTLTLEVEEGFLPAVNNDPDLVRAALSPLRAVLGPEGVLELTRPTLEFGEDFARFQQHVPGVMYWLGVSNSELGYLGLPHSPDFQADDEAIFFGARAMAAVLLDQLGAH